MDILYKAIDEVTDDDDDINEVMFSFNITQKLSDELVLCPSPQDARGRLLDSSPTLSEANEESTDPASEV